MPVTPRPLASAMMVPTRSVALPTTAGHQVQFRNGVASINDTRDLPYLLGRSDVRLEVSEYAMSWMPDVLAKTRIINASVHWPEGYDVVHHHADDFDIITPTPPQEETEPGNDLAASCLDPSGGGIDPPTEPPVEVSLPDVLPRKRWQKPPSNSSAN